MPGGLIQLSAYGSENAYLNGNPQITFFKLVYKKHTNFSMESIEHSLQGPQELSFDKSSKLKIKIPRNGDLLSNIYLKLKLPEIRSHDTKEFYWINKIGTNIIDYCDLFVGGNRIERLEGQYIDLYNQLTISEQKKYGYQQMIGNDPSITYNSSYPHDFYRGFNYNEFQNQDKKYINKFYNSSPSIFQKILYIPLPFFFTKNYGLSLPLIALQYHDIELEIQLKPVKDLYTITKKDKTYYYYKNNNHYYSKSQGIYTADPSKSRTDAASNNNLSTFSFSYRKKPDLLDKNEHISNFINNQYNEFTWDIEPILDINYIFLDTNERKVFAKITHEYLIQQVIKIEKNGLQGSSIIELEAFHPIKEIMFIAKRDDNDTRNEWSNYTTSPTFSNGINTVFDYQNNWWYNSNNVAKNPINFIHQNSYDDNLESTTIVCDKFQELLFRYGPYGESADDAPTHDLTILGFYKQPYHNLYTINDIISFRKSWLFYEASNIPVININNYNDYTENPIIDCKLKFNGQSRQDKHTNEYFRYIQPYQHHNSIPNTPIHIYSFSLKPDEYQPSGSCNFSRLKNVEFEINLKNTPIAKNQISGNGNITREWLYDIHFYLINYNIFKISYGLGGIVFSN